MSRYLSFDSRNFSAGSTFADPEGSYIRVRMSSIRLGAITLISVMLLTAACGGDTPPPITSSSKADQSDFSREQGKLPLWRYVNSGWISPLDRQSTSVFSRELRADVITSAFELEEFNRTVISKRTRGTGVSLNRADFPGSVVLVAYLMWMPMQGDPLSVIEIEINGRHVVVNLDLDKDPQGRRYPYLFAPMTMVALDRSEFPAGGLVSFDFVLDNELQLTLKDDLR